MTLPLLSLVEHVVVVLTRVVGPLTTTCVDIALEQRFHFVIEVRLQLL